MAQSHAQTVIRHRKISDQQKDTLSHLENIEEIDILYQFALKYDIARPANGVFSLGAEFPLSNSIGIEAWVGFTTRNYYRDLVHDESQSFTDVADYKVVPNLYCKIAVQYYFDEDIMDDAQFTYAKYQYSKYKRRFNVSTNKSFSLYKANQSFGLGYGYQGFLDNNFFIIIKTGVSYVTYDLASYVPLSNEAFTIKEEQGLSDIWLNFSFELAYLFSIPKKK